MEFVELTEDEFKKFYVGRKDENFMQSVELGNLKRSEGKKVYYYGIKKNNQIKCATLLYDDITFCGRKVFYAPRGFLVDYHDKDLLIFFVKKLKQELKKHKGFKLVIDPNVVYRERNSDGSIKDEKETDTTSFDNLTSLGFKHFGFNIYLEARQVRWAYRMKLDEPYEQKKINFSKSTRKNLETSISNGLCIRKGSEKDIEKMQELFQNTADRKHFYYRKKDYYVEMYKYMKSLMTIYFAYLDPDKYYESCCNKLNDEKKKLEEIRYKMQHDMVGNKLKNNENTCLNRIDKYEKEIQYANEFKEKYPNGLDVACLLSMSNGEEYLTLTSGSLEEYRKFTPKYAMYDAHIKDAYKKGFKYCNFYGISGNFKNENNPLYGVYEFKRGFGGNVIEYIGEFELGISFFDNIYNFLRKIKRMIK